MPKKVLISGYKGFVGTNLINYLKQKNLELFGLSRSIENQNSVTKNFSWDQLNEIKNQSFDVIIHLAGKAHDLKNTSDPEEYFQVNTELTKKLFDLFLQSDTRDFIYLSSVKAAADVVVGILDEMATPDPKTPYGKSKLKAEEYILNYDISPNKRAIILRPCMIHGPGNKGNFNLLYRFIKKRIPYPLAAFENRRSFLSIQNLCFVIHQVLINPSIPGGIYNIADDEPLSTNELIKIIGNENNIHPISWKINRSFVKVLAKAGDKLNLPFNSERLGKLTENYVVSNSKIKSALQVESLPISSREGFSTTLKSF